MSGSRGLRLGILAGIAATALLLGGCRHSSDNGNDTSAQVNPTAAASAIQDQAAVVRGQIDQAVATAKADPGGKKVLAAAAKCKPLDKGGLDAVITPADSINDWKLRITAGKYMTKSANRKAFIDCLADELNLTDAQKAKLKELLETAAYARAKSIPWAPLPDKLKLKQALAFFAAKDLLYAYDVATGAKPASSTPPWNEPLPSASDDASAPSASASDDPSAEPVPTDDPSSEVG